MRGLNSSSQAYIEDGNVPFSFQVIHDPAGSQNDLTNDVISYSWEFDVMSQSSATIILRNPETSDGSGYRKYSPEAVASGSVPIKDGDEIKIIEGIESDTFDKFYGVVKQVVPSESGGSIQITVLDKLSRLGEMEWDYVHEASTTRVSMERVDPVTDTDTEFFYATISSVSSTSITYSSDSGESTLTSEGHSGLNILYNFNRRTTRIISAVDTGTNTITTKEKSDSWAVGDLISNKTWHGVFDLDHTDIKPGSVVLVIRNLFTTADDEPVYKGFGLNAQSGQIVLNSALNLANYGLYASYEYYPSGLYVEDIIETIATTADVYGNSVFSSSDIQETYQNVEGSGQTDTLSGSGNTWYTKYDNVVTTLTSSDFTITGGSFVSFDQRTGTLTTSGSPSSVECTTNYTFKTLQTTGIQVPYFWVSDRTTKSRFDAISELLKVVAPNYRIYVRGNGKLWGKYFSQSSTEDDSVSLTSGNFQKLDFYPDEDTYTRVKVFAKNLAPSNILSKAHFEWSAAAKIKVEDGALSYLGVEGSYYLYRIVDLTGFVANYPYPVLKIDGSNIQNRVKTFEDYIGYDVDIEYLPGLNDGPVAKIQLLNQGIIESSVSIEDENEQDLGFNGDDILSYSIDAENGIIYFYNVEGLELIARIVYDVLLWGDADTGSDFVVDFSGGVVLVNQTYVDNDPNRHILTLDYYYYPLGWPGISAPVNFTKMLDGSLQSSASWAWRENPITNYSDDPNGAIIFVVSWDSAQDVDGIKITAGYFDPEQHGYLEYSRRFDCSFRLTIKYSSSTLFTAVVDGSQHTTPTSGGPGYLNDTDTTIYVYAARNINALSSSGEIWIDGEKIHYSSYSDLGGNKVRFNSCTRGYDGTVARNHEDFGYYGILYRNVRSDATFSEICGELTNADFSTGTTIDVDRSALGENFTMGALMCVVEGADPITFYMQTVRSNATEVTVYPVAIADFRVETDRYLKSDIQLVAPGNENDTSLDDDLGLRTQLGERTYKRQLEQRKILYTQTRLNIYAKNLLKEFYKNHTRASLVEMVNPSWELGMTLRVISSLNNIDRRYFVEKIRSDNGVLSLELAYFP